MNWQMRRAVARERYVAKFDHQQAADYDTYVGTLSAEDEVAYLRDLQMQVPLCAGMQVLDCGAGSGTLSKILSQVNGLSLSALEPSPAMLQLLREKPGLSQVNCVQGFCDAESDRGHFQAAQFDLIASRQVTNGLFDPLVAFRNWHYWLKPGGCVAVIEGLYARTAWSGAFEEEVDVMPLSATQSLATIPYLLEQVGFEIHSVGLMLSANAQPATRTPRYLVVACRGD